MAYSSPGVDWLATNSNIDGSIHLASDIATPPQSTSEAIRAFHLLDELPPAGISESLAFIDAVSHHTTEYLSRKVISKTHINEDVSNLVAELLTHHNSDGGFGDLPGYASTVIDTAFALEALVFAGQISNESARAAVSYLFSKQAVDGSWQDNGIQSPIYITALVIQVLTPFKQTFLDVEGIISHGVVYLTDQRNASGLWGEVYLSALSLIAVLPNVSDITSMQSSIDTFLSTQQLNGSWGDDVYQTALALRARYVIDTALMDPTLSEIQGSVVDAQTGMPLANVHVTLTGSTNES